MTALDTLRGWAAMARRVKLSTYVIAVFALAFVVPWCVFAWLTVAGRAEQVAKTQQNLVAAASGYAEHAATLVRLGMSVPVGTAPSNPDLADAAGRGEQEMAAFRRALDLPGVILSLRAIESPNIGSNIGGPPPVTTAVMRHDDATISAEIARPDAGIAAIAAMSEDLALEEWRKRVTVQGVALLLRSLFVLGIAVFLVSQLRAKEKLQADLMIARESAEVASRAKSDFLANTSHELRTPLNAIIGFSEIIKTGMFGPLSLRYREYAGDIFNSGTHLLGLINEILDLSKLEAGQLTLYEEDVDLAVVVRDSVRLVEAQAGKLNIELSEIVPDAFPLIRADDRRMRQILINLLSNAVKFTPEGGRVQVVVSRGSGGLILQVSDTGIGMPPEQIAKALEPFGQIDSEISRKFEGTGLGLPIAKRLAELHGGTLTVNSQANSGTTVIVTLPAERAVRSRVFAAALAAG